jgi:hypothetical protein
MIGAFGPRCGDEREKCEDAEAAWLWHREPFEATSTLAMLASMLRRTENVCVNLVEV